MSQPVPLPLATRLQDEVDAFCSSISRCDVYNTFVFARMLRDLETLAKDNQAREASIQKARLFSATNQFEEYERWVRNLENLKYFDDARIVRFMHFINHGFASKALTLVDDVFSHPAGRNLMLLAEGAAAIGACQKAVALIDDSIDNHYVLQRTENVTILRNIAFALQELHVNDEQLAAMIDVAGEILRENDLYWLDRLPQMAAVTRKSDTPYFNFNYRVSVTPEEAAAMTWKLTETLIDRGLERDGIYLGFFGSTIPSLQPA